MKIFLAVCVSGGLVLLSGCAGSISKPPKYARIDPAPPKNPPPGKALVCIHRPRSHTAWAVKSGLWDGLSVIAVVGSGNSVAYVCDPGQHYFLNRSFDQLSAVEATLLSDQTYDLWIDPGSTLAATLKLKPVKPGTQDRARVSEWVTANLWLTRDPSAEELERLDREFMQRLIQDFASGPRHRRLEYLAAEDHR